MFVAKDNTKILNPVGVEKSKIKRMKTAWDPRQGSRVLGRDERSKKKKMY
jgi:hypothetical protein